ncbi:MAG: hypothetical protein JW733_06100 [Coriobacteriia bacterium]|nr:hypothetical protein [Coriobacteriia bacterium]MBN2839575.1 hypothetical protein [Coriobacteriia bacterium]
MLDILIIMNNYFHDVATAVLVAAAAIMWVLYRRALTGGPDTLVALRNAYPSLTTFARWALVWVILGGIPRVFTFNTHDLGAVHGDMEYLIPAIAVKHIFEVAAVVAGVVLWQRVKARFIQSAAGVSSHS